ncbi:MAG: PadR family transcriptional regulator [Bacteroidetes bacterium]|nr:PadR family transcriptional regulator [Bacteroidota bacterium]
MNIENTKAQMRKGVLEFCILSILSDGDAYPTEIIERMKLARLVVVEGTLYPLLTRLKNMDLLTYRWEESTSGPPRKYYRLTETGISFLRELEATWDELVASVEQVTQKPQQQAISAAVPFNPEAAPQPEKQANNHTTTNDNTEVQ